MGDVTPHLWPSLICSTFEKNLLMDTLGVHQWSYKKLYEHIVLKFSLCLFKVSENLQNPSKLLQYINSNHSNYNCRRKLPLNVNRVKTRWLSKQRKPLYPRRVKIVMAWNVWVISQSHSHPNLIFWVSQITFVPGSQFHLFPFSLSFTLVWQLYGLAPGQPPLSLPHWR